MLRVQDEDGVWTAGLHLYAGDFGAIAADAQGAHGPASLIHWRNYQYNTQVNTAVRAGTCLLLNPGAGAAHENCNVGDERVKVANGASVLIRAAGKPSDKGDSFSLKLQVRTHEEGQDGSKVACSNGVSNACTVRQP